MNLQTDLTDNNYTKGYLFPEDVWGDRSDGFRVILDPSPLNDWFPPNYFNSSGIIPQDIDVFKIDLESGEYCIETKLANDAPLDPLEITVYEANASGDNYGDQIKLGNSFNCLDDGGGNNYMHQRLYFTHNTERKVFVKIKSTESDFEGEYKIRCFRARPVILVHGIECYPKEDDDIVLGNNSMGHWNDYLQWDINCYPCICYNFCWDSGNDEHDLEYNPVGDSIIKDIVNCPPEQNPSVVKLEDTHKMNVVLIAHSMGGYFVRYALEKQESYNLIHKAITLGTPHYGSDVALGSVGDLTVWFKQTTKINLLALRRGSDFVWEMNKWGGKNKLVCFAGYDAPIRAPSWIPYTKGLAHSDGVVPVSSGFVKGAINENKTRADHGTIGIATYVDQENYPLDEDPSAVSAIIERFFGNNKGQNRIAPELIIGDSKYNTIYKKVRSYIAP